MNLQNQTLGGLECQVVDKLPAGQQPEFIVILCHGFGAPGTDLVALGSELYYLESRLEQNTRFIFPAAPLSLAEQGMPGGRAWWQLDMEQITAAIQRGEMRDQRAVVPEGLPEARELLSNLVYDVRRCMQVDVDRMVLGGFSQGSMLATDVALRLSETAAGLCIFSGTLLCEEEWRKQAVRHQSLPVLQSHGYRDPILPYAGAEWLLKMLTDAGLSVEFVPFDGMHTIPPEALERFAKMLKQITSGN